MSQCVKREPIHAKGKDAAGQSPTTSWFTARGAFFSTLKNVYTHSIADQVIEKRPIKKYRIQVGDGADGTWTEWYYPGYNDVVHPDDVSDKLGSDATEDEKKWWNSVWNEKSYLAGRRRWTSFDTNRHEICFYPDYARIEEVTDCEWRAPQGEAWMTARGREFLTPEAVYLHGISDLLLDNRRIARYRLKHGQGRTSPWFFPGLNDNEVRQSHQKADNATWNEQTKAAGRRQWTFFSSRVHEVCYFKKPAKFPPLEYKAWPLAKEILAKKEAHARAQAAGEAESSEKKQEEPPPPPPPPATEAKPATTGGTTAQVPPAAAASSTTTPEGTTGAEKKDAAGVAPPTTTTTGSYMDLVTAGQKMIQDGQEYLAKADLIKAGQKMILDGTEYLNQADIVRAGQKLIADGQEYLSKADIVKTGQQMVADGQVYLAKGGEQMLTAGQELAKGGQQMLSAGGELLLTTGPQQFNANTQLRAGGKAQDNQQPPLLRMLGPSLCRALLVTFFVYVVSKILGRGGGGGSKNNDKGLSRRKGHVSSTGNNRNSWGSLFSGGDSPARSSPAAAAAGSSKKSKTPPRKKRHESPSAARAGVEKRGGRGGTSSNTTTPRRRGQSDDSFNILVI